MIGLIKNEIVKIYSSKKIFASIIVLMIASFWILAGSINRYDDKVKELEQTKSSTTMHEDSRKEIIDSDQESIDKYKKAKEWSMDEVKESYKEGMESLEKENPDKSDEVINCHYNFIKYLDDNNLRQTTNLDLDSNGIMQRSVSALSLIAILVVILITSDTISNEFNSGTLKLLITKPFSRNKIIFSKFIACTIVSSILLLSFEVILYVIGIVIKGYTSLSYPEKIFPLFNYSSSLNTELNRYLQPILGTSEIIPQWQVFLRCFVLQVFFIAAIVSISILFSVLIKKEVIVTMAGIFAAFLSIGVTMSDSNIVKYCSYLLPYNYFDSFKVVTRQGLMETGASYLNNIVGIIILSIYIAICIILSCRLINKKNVYI